SPAALKIKQLIADEEQSLAKMRNNLIPGVTKDVRQHIRFETARTVQQLQTRIAVAEEDEKVLNTVVANLRKTIKEQAESVGEAEREDMTCLEDAVKRIAQEEESLRIELQAPNRYSVLEEAVVTKPTENKRVLMAAGGAGLGTFAAVLLVCAMLEFRVRRLCT